MKGRTTSMATEDRITVLERSIDDINHNVTILVGVTGDQGRDIRTIKEQLSRVGIRLDGMDQHLDTMDKQLQVQFASMNQRFDAIMTLLKNLQPHQGQ